MATDIAEWLVREGVAFKDAHEIAGACVKVCEAEGIELSDLTDEQLATVSEHLTPAVKGVLTVSGSINSRDSRGGTAPGQVAQQLGEIQAELRKAQAWINSTGAGDGR